ncbi:1270_t:CDS:1, partial [Racocetra persica]
DGAITILYCATSPEIEEKNYREKCFEPFDVTKVNDLQMLKAMIWLKGFGKFDK